MAVESQNVTRRVSVQRKSRRFALGKAGQATIEMALTLPFLIWLISYTFNAYYMMHTAHVGQKYAAMHLYKRLNNRAQFVMDDGNGPGESSLHGKKFMAMQFVDESGELPKRRIMFAPRTIDNVVGLCREADCR